MSERAEENTTLLGWSFFVLPLVRPHNSNVLRCNNFPVKCKGRINSVDDSNLQLNSMTGG